MGLAVIDGPNPAHPRRDETTLVTMFSGASGPLNGGGSVCGEMVAIGLAVTVIGDDAVTGAARLEVLVSGLGVVLFTRNELADFSVETVIAGCSCGRENVEIADVSLCGEALGALVPCFGDGVAGVTGTSSPSADVLVVVAAESSSTVVCGSGVGAFSTDVSSDSVDDVDSTGFFLSVDDVAEESAALVEADDVALESVGSANATPGVVATAHPTPRATANAPTRPTYLT